MMKTMARGLSTRACDYDLPRFPTHSPIGSKLVPSTENEEGDYTINEIVA